MSEFEENNEIKGEQADSVTNTDVKTGSLNLKTSEELTERRSELPFFKQQTMNEIVIKGKGSTSQSFQKVKIVNAEGMTLVEIKVQDDGSGLEVKTPDGKTISKP